MEPQCSQYGLHPEIVLERIRKSPNGFLNRCRGDRTNMGHKTFSWTRFLSQSRFSCKIVMKRDCSRSESDGQVDTYLDKHRRILRMLSFKPEFSPNVLGIFH